MDPGANTEIKLSIITIMNINNTNNNFTQSK